MEKSDLTVVIPLYNKRDFIGRAIRSVINQTSMPAETIVVDDGSTDDSIRMVSGWRGLIPIKVIQQENQGVSAARNLGIQRCETAYFALLDADDEWLPNHIEVLRQGFKEHPEALAVSGRTVEDDIPGVPKSFDVWIQQSDFTALSFERVTNYTRRLRTGQYGLHSSCIAFNRSAFNQANLGFIEQLQQGEDLNLWIRAVAAGPVYIANRTTARYRRDDDKSTTRAQAQISMLPGSDYLSFLQGSCFGWREKLELHLLARKQFYFAAYREHDIGELNVPPQIKTIDKIFYNLILATPRLIKKKIASITTRQEN